MPGGVGVEPPYTPSSGSGVPLPSVRGIGGGSPSPGPCEKRGHRSETRL